MGQSVLGQYVCFSGFTICGRKGGGPEGWRGAKNRKSVRGVGDVVGVVTPLGGVAQVVFHGVKVVEVGVVLRVHQDRGEEEDGEGQVEVEREEGEVRGEPHMYDDGVKWDPRTS